MPEVTFDAADVLLNLTKVFQRGLVAFLGLYEHLQMAHANVRHTFLRQYQCCSYTIALQYKLHNHSQHSDFYSTNSSVQAG